MLAFYNATGGANWTTTTWDTNTSHLKTSGGGYLPNWDGLRVNTTSGRVTELVLPNNNLTGPLPPALSSLTALEKLGLSNNNLTGPLPPALNSLTALEELEFGNNHLSGPIPDLSGLTKLTKIDLFNNFLTGAVPDIGTLSTKLTALYLDYNLLTGPIPVPADLTTLPGFRDGFNFDYNENACLPNNTAFLNWHSTTATSVDAVRVHCNLDAPTAAAPTLTAGPGRITMALTTEPARTTPAFTPSHYEVQWRHCTGTGNQCTSADKWSPPGDRDRDHFYYRLPGLTHTIALADLVPGGTHEVRYRVLDIIYAVAPNEKYNGTKWSTAVTTTLPTVTLFARFATTDAALTVTNWLNEWWYQKQGDTACTKVDAGTTGVDLSGLTAGASYTYTAYRDDACSKQMDDVTFSTLSAAVDAPAAPTLTPDTANGGKITATWSAYSSQIGDFTVTQYEVRYRECSGSTCTGTEPWQPVPGKIITAPSVSTTFTTELTPTKYYQVRYRALDVDDNSNYAASPWSTASSAVQVPAATLTHGTLTATGATLTIGTWPNPWWYKGTQSGATCTAVSTGTIATPRDLRPNTAYTYKAYRADGCANADEIASEPFTTS